MGKAYALGTAIIAFFLLGATWDKPEETEQKWFSTPKVDWDSPRGAFDAEKQYDKPPRGWYWQDNVGDFPIPTEWPEWVVERFRQLVMGEKTNDLVQLRRWASETLELNTPWIDAKSDKVKDYILAKSDRYAFFTVFRLMDNAGNSKEGIVEQDFKGQAKIYGLNEEIQYKIACFDANGVVGTAATALSDKFIRTYNPVSSVTPIEARDLYQDRGKNIYLSYNEHDQTGIERIDLDGNVSWSYDTAGYSGTEKSRIVLDDDGNIGWIIGTYLSGGVYKNVLSKIDSQTGTVLWTVTPTGIFGVIPEIRGFTDIDDYAVLVGHEMSGTSLYYNDFIYTYQKIDGSAKYKWAAQGIHQYGVSKLHPPSFNKRYLSSMGIDTHNYPHITDTCISQTKDRGKLIIGGYDWDGYQDIILTSGITLASVNIGSNDPDVPMPREPFEGSERWVDKANDPAYLGWDFGVSNKQAITAIRLYFAASTNCGGAGTFTAKFQYSNDDLTVWTTLRTFTCAESGIATAVYDVANSTAYRAYRLYCENTSNDTSIYSLGLLGAKYNTGPIIMSVKTIGGDEVFPDQAGRTLAKGFFSTDSYFTSVCEGYDGSYTAVGAVTGFTSTFVASMNPSGVTKWEYTYNVGTHPYSISPTEDKGYIIAGSDGDPDASWDAPLAYLLKINKNGKEEWRRYFEPTPDMGTVFYKAIQTQDKGFLAVGSLRETATLSEIYIVKTNRHGESCSPGVPCE